MTGNTSTTGDSRRALRDAAGPDEGELIAAVAGARMDAFEALYRIYRPRLQRFVGGITRRAGLVDEVVDDTMMVVWRKAATFQRGARASTWIFAIAYRQALRALHRIDDAIEYHADVDAPGGADPEAQRARGELRSGLDRALLQLSPEQRAAIELTYYWGHSCAEVAEILQCPVDTVKTRMFYGRRRLRELLGPAWRESA